MNKFTPFAFLRSISRAPAANSKVPAPIVLNDKQLANVAGGGLARALPGSTW